MLNLENTSLLDHNFMSDSFPLGHAWIKACWKSYLGDISGPICNIAMMFQNMKNPFFSCIKKVYMHMQTVKSVYYDGCLYLPLILQ